MNEMAIAIYFYDMTHQVEALKPEARKSQPSYQTNI